MSKIKTLNSALLVVGTSIGAGMLGLPVETGRGGLFFSIALLLINWAIMTFTALLLVELLVRFKKRVNFISLSDKILGPSFKIVTFAVYIGLFLSLTLAYTKGGGIFITDLFTQIPLFIGSIIFLAIFVPLIIFGPKILGLANTALTIGLFFSFAVLVGLGITKITKNYLFFFDWKLALYSWPMFITSFGFHSVLPSIGSYLNYKKKNLRIAVIGGTSITLIVYLAWQLIVLGNVPIDGQNSLTSALALDQTAITPLRAYLKSPFLDFFAEMFYFTALSTSFLGVGLGLIDFLLDSFRISAKLTNRILLALLLYLPAWAIVQTEVRIFYISLKYGAGIACTYLLILLPILLYVRHKKCVTE